LAKERLKGNRAKMRFILHLRGEERRGEEKEESAWAHILRRRGRMR
jgi:hypothetical protein